MKTEEYLAKNYEIKAPKEGDSLQSYNFILNSSIYDLEGKIEKKIKLHLNLEKSKLLKIIEQIKKAINEYESSFENVFVLNEYLKLKYENGATHIYVGDDYFRQCAYLLLNIPGEDIEDYDDIKSIDDAENRLSHKLHGFYNIKRKKEEYGIDPKQEFIGHCSNLQAWVENDYNTQILHRNLAFPLLKKLVEVGDPKARRAYKEELAYRLEANELNVTIYLLKEKYLKDLSHDELELIIENMKPGIAKIILQGYLEELKIPINFDNKKSAFKISEDAYVTSYERNNFTFKDYKRPFNLQSIDKYSRELFDGSLIDFGIKWNQYKVLFKKTDILKAQERFTDKDSILVEIPRSKAPLKLYVKEENLAIYIYPTLMF